MNKLNKVLLLSILFILFLFFIIPSFSFAQDSGMHYVISGTRPGNGENNVPPNLKTGATGSVCGSSGSDSICTIMIGLGIASNNPITGVGYPRVTYDLFSPDKVTISSSNDPNISTKMIGEQEWADGGNFYHNFQFLVTNFGYPNGIILMPNTTYTVTIKGGPDGLKAKYEGNQVYMATLAQDYTFSFTTGSGSTPARYPSPTPTPTDVPPTNTPVPPTNTPTPIIIYVDRSSSSQNQNNNPTLTATPTVIDNKPINNDLTKTNIKLTNAPIVKPSVTLKKPIANGKTTKPSSSTAIKVINWVNQFFSSLLNPVKFLFQNLFKKNKHG